jgi:signal transduction histidine kinase
MEDRPLNSTRSLFIIIVSVILVFAINYIIYYNVTKTTLEKNYDREIQSIAKQIQNSLEQSRSGTELYEHMIGKMLRTSAIAAQHALPSKIEQVDHEKLLELTHQLQLQGLTLLVEKNNDIVLEKSSNPSENGLSTKDWGLWRNAFQELFHYKNVISNWGQTLPNFWTGPYEIATSNTERISKWGYYYDGTTDYILDPYIGDDDIRQYRKVTGIDSIISSMKDAYPHILEITGINPETFDKDVTFTLDNGEEMKSLVHRPYFYGTYQIKNENDVRLVKEAYQNKKTVSTVYRAGGRNIMKTFIHVPDVSLQEALAEDRSRLDSYVLLITSDYDIIQNRLDQQFDSLLTMVSFYSVLSLIVIVLILKLINRSNNIAVRQTAETYIEEMNEMFLNIRGQRHDFLNHVNVIHNYIQLGHLDQLKKYTTELVGEVKLQNEIIRIGEPAISALIQSKWTTALTKKINFKLDYDQIERSIEGVQSTDIVRILGNLIDNAFDEVEELSADSRNVDVKISSEQNMLVFRVSNPVQSMKDFDLATLSKAGVTSKSGEHQGLGLYITRQLLKKYRGKMEISFNRDENVVTFIVSIPYHG